MLLQHRLLESDPLRTLARFPVGKTPPARAAPAAQSPKHLLAALQRNASNEVEQVAIGTHGCTSVVSAIVQLTEGGSRKGRRSPRKACTRCRDVAIAT